MFVTIVRYADFNRNNSSILIVIVTGEVNNPTVNNIDCCVCEWAEDKVEEKTEPRSSSNLCQ